ncbi:BNR-4 repeat-containing protein [Enterococcus sp. AZ126]|uniref:BNR-4 repeat-containing protein n=1 Tax=Enterococcus sp. AZ126 TaxID=2774635 RepID=UPI003F222976
MKKEKCGNLLNYLLFLGVTCCFLLINSSVVRAEILTSGSNKNLLDHLRVANENDFSSINKPIEIKEATEFMINNINNYVAKSNLGATLSPAIGTDRDVGYQQFEKGTVFTSEEGTFSVKIPILNTFNASGGLEVLGKPIEEQMIEDGFFIQKFENGVLTAKNNDILQTSPSSLMVRRKNTYHIKNTLSPGEADKVVTYGKTEDEVYVGDWTGEQKNTLMVRRGNTYYIKNTLSPGEADKVVIYGKDTDEVYVGDWNGDGKSTLMVRRGNTYYIKNSLSPGEADKVVIYGKDTDEVYVGDWNGDGKSTLMVRRGNTYYIKNTLSPGEADKVVIYGKATDEVYVGDWNGDGKSTLMVRRGNTYYIKNTLDIGEADRVVRYGKDTDKTYVGSWADPQIISTDTEIIDFSDPLNVKFNHSQNFKYSQLTAGFSGNSVNATSFRKSSLFTHVDNTGKKYQYAAFYDYTGTIVLASCVDDGDWYYRWTTLKGTINDAHNIISIAVDGKGYIHMAWSNHAGSLFYAKSQEANSTKMIQQEMLGSLENRVTYPEFLVQPDGNMFFLYRNGGSGSGNTVLNKYNSQTGTWSRLHNNLISGEGADSAYWQAVVDQLGCLHISWVWRETTDVKTNHDMSYAVSIDNTGEKFMTSKGVEYEMPIKKQNAEVIIKIPQNSSLINQTSMTVDDNNLPYIISYWRINGSVQYNILRNNGNDWDIYDTNIRTTDFELGGVGTKKLEMARPQILVSGTGNEAKIFLLIRDDEFFGKLSLVKMQINDDNRVTTEELVHVTADDVGDYEPNYDIQLWNNYRKLKIFLQHGFYRNDGATIVSKNDYIFVIDATSFVE